MEASYLPFWAKKPESKNGVLATDRGWVDAKTKEVLKSQQNLKSMLNKLKDEVDEAVKAIAQPAYDIVEQQNSKKQSEFVEEVIQPPKRKAGRPKGSKNKKSV